MELPWKAGLCHAQDNGSVNGNHRTSPGYLPKSYDSDEAQMSPK